VTTTTLADARADLLAIYGAALADADAAHTAARATAADLLAIRVIHDNAVADARVIHDAALADARVAADAIYAAAADAAYTTYAAAVRRLKDTP